MVYITIQWRKQIYNNNNQLLLLLLLVTLSLSLIKNPNSAAIGVLMEMEAVKRSQEGAGRGRSRYIKLQVCSRVTAGLAALAAATLMGFNKQTSVVAGFAIEASYRFSPAFKSVKLGADRVHERMHAFPRFTPLT